ncbi:MAG: AMP-binding protein [Myxococcales bacterium]|nr:AMP-binding protein [Myxococcales bacterium]
MRRAMGLLFHRLTSGDDGVVLRLRVRATGAEERLTARALTSRCGRVVQALAERGVRPGQRVGVWAQGTLDTLVALTATAVGGYVTVPLDPKLGPLELGHLAKDAQPVVALASDPEAVAGRLSGVPVLGVPAGEAALTTHRAVDDEPLLILYTSGTTGLPKGAVLSARNVAFNLDALAQAWGWTRADVVVHALPLFHVHGLVLGLYGSLRNGAGLDWLPRFSPEVVEDALSPIGGEGKVLFAVPTMYHRLADAAENSQELVAALQSARLLISGSAALPLRDHQRLHRLTGRRVLERYGLTETLINTAVLPGSESEAGRVGQPLEGVELRLVDDARQPLASFDDATIGEVAVRGPHVFLGYLNRPDATAAVKDEGGWYYTGDLATRRADGSVRIVGRRATDLIKCGGYKVGAGEVEAALLEHPQVREAAVVGRPDADLGEKIVAFVVTSGDTTPAALQDFVAKQLSPHKRPREVRVVDSLPRNAMGKVQKAKLP